MPELAAPDLDRRRRRRSPLAQAVVDAAIAAVKAAAASTRTRSSSTTWPTPPPPSPPHGPASTTAPRARSRPGSPAPSSPTPCATSASGWSAARRSSASTPGLDGAGRRVRGHLLRPGLPGPPGRRRRDRRHLDEDFTLVAETFHRFAEEQVRPRAEHIHRTNGDIPEELISGLAEIGGLGLSVPEEYGGFATGGDEDYIGMVVATEELTWGSLGIGGSLITRPEILTRALVNGGTEEQKQRWLPKLATGEILAAVAVTEPDYGCDVAGLHDRGDARPRAAGSSTGPRPGAPSAPGPNVLMLLARTDPDRSKAHRGLSLFVVEKPVGEGHGFLFAQDGRGRRRLEGRPIDTIGYRGMHSYEISFDNWFVPDDNLVGGEAGIGRGFYLQMAGFENGRIQTAARAIGDHAGRLRGGLRLRRESRRLRRAAILDYQLTRVKLATHGGRSSRPAASTRSRWRMLMAKGEGSLEASMAKAYVCRAAEWVTREAMQIHGGMGYAEEYAVSRYFVDARVLSIFEGADETLCLKVIARRLLDSHS